MRFIANGPDIPGALLQAQEEGRVVFFCGAGISYPAGLPDFEGLVRNIYEHLEERSEPREPLEKDAFEKKQFDTTLNLLEQRIPGGRDAVRKALEQVLKPKLHRKGATDTHIALLQLARNRKGPLRLVTTNFDRVFEHAAKKIKPKQPFSAYVAPMLPIPKKSDWDGLVYLHGRLPAKTDDRALQRLVLTSGDFGLAYLTERWAARFVSELFRNHVVCFIGYSINDPVLRYMMDALAVHRMMGEVASQAYALGGCKPGQEDKAANEWKAKGVTPILYDENNGHSALHQTLKAWAETYRDGVFGKERIVVEHAYARPSPSTRQDDFVRRMRWALSDASGLPAKRFAELDPVPPLDWLDALSDECFEHGDLGRFRIPANDPIDSKLRFSLIQRPTPYSHAPRMALVDSKQFSEWDEVMRCIADWLTRHLNDPRLIHWRLERGGQLHPRWSRLLVEKLDQLDTIRSSAPNAVPCPPMHTLWRLLLAGRVKSPRWFGDHPDFYDWNARIKRDGLNTTLRLELRELLMPMFNWKKPAFWSDQDVTTEPPRDLRQCVNSELVLAADNVYYALRDLTDTPRADSPSPAFYKLLRTLTDTQHWQQALLDDFQHLLRDALDLLREMGEADDRSDSSYRPLPSISPHWQNQGFHDWVVLIELLRDAWLEVRRIDPVRSTRIAQTWFDLPYPTFKRLALFAAAQDGCIAPERWAGWLLADDAWWLWSKDTQRETMRLLAQQGSHLTLPARRRLEDAILAGPPRDVYPDNLDLDPGQWCREKKRAVWLRLTRLETSGLGCGAAIMERLKELSDAHPDWEKADERDEFLRWISASGDPDYEERQDIHTAPRIRRDLANRWQEALQGWSEKDRVLRSWRHAAPLVQTMPTEVLQEIVHGLARWLDAVSKYVEQHESIFLSLCGRILDLLLDAASSVTRSDGSSIQEPVTEAINHPIGHVTDALLDFGFRHGPNDNDRLPGSIEPIFSKLCNTEVDRFRHGRVLLALRLIPLFRVDQPWTEQHLLPLFDWTTNSVEAKAAWAGFLWSPRLYEPLLIALKSQFLATAHHYADLEDDSRRQFARLLTYAALESVDGYTTEDFRTAIEALPKDGLQEVAQTLAQAIEAAGSQRENYWKNRVQPFWQKVWPKSPDRWPDNIAESLARVSIAAGDEFPSAFKAVQYWLRPIEFPYYVVHLLDRSGLCKRFPNTALQLLAKVINVVNASLPAPKELRKFLNEIAQAKPQLERDHRYQQLWVYAHQRE